MNEIGKRRRINIKVLWIIVIPVIIGLSYYISTYHFQLVMIQGNSMEPAYHEYQIVLIDKHIRPYSYGDVIVFKCNNSDYILIKRVAAIPGDVVYINEGTLWINGEKSTVYPDEGVFVQNETASQPLTLFEGQYFVIGDNIMASIDSRFYEVGLVDSANICGVVC
ncbi:MAG: signal peptidase I [Oscillospiraceae bacterium]|nr:signal peptidase I [Oscillospiraceae bacterium]